MVVAESVPVSHAPAKEKKVANHPSYNAMIKEAIASLKEKRGSSRQAIFKYILERHEVRDDNLSRAHLKLALKRGVAKGELKRSKVVGALSSIKLGTEKKTVNNSNTKKTVNKLTVKPKFSKKDVGPQRTVAKKPQVSKLSKKPSAKKAVRPKAK